MPYSKRRKTSTQAKIGLIIFLPALILALTLYFGVNLANSEDKSIQAKDINIDDFENQSPNYSSPKTAEIRAENLSSNNEWLSPVTEADFSFDALGASWKKDDNSTIDILVRFSGDNKAWSEYQPLIVEDADQAKENSPSAKNNSVEASDLIFYQDAKYFQYKVIFKDEIDSAYLENIKFTYINADGRNSNKQSWLKRMLSAKKAAAVNSPRIISRAEWGADPAYMSWPPEYAVPNKIIIHHTASGNNPPNPSAVVRSIYYYHAVSLGWGDIGYNYLFDQYGNIYEGRAGGNGAIGAHAYGQNTGSIGFSVVGTFSSANITNETYGAIADLMAFKSVENGFDVNYSTFFGHRDFCNNPPGHNCTACPGDILYSRRGELIESARQRIGTYLARDREFLNQTNNVVVKSYSGPAIYLWQNGQKRLFVDLVAFTALGYSSNDINLISQFALDERPNGEPIHALVKTDNNPAVYLATDHYTKKFLIPSGDVFNDYNFNGNNIKLISLEDLNAMADAGELKINIKRPDNPTIYRLIAGVKYPYPNVETYNNWSNTGFSTLPGAMVDIYPQGRLISNLIATNSPGVYLLLNGQKHLIPSVGVFEAWGFSWSDIIVLDSVTFNSFPNGQNLSFFAKGSGPAIYILARANKYPFPDIAMLDKWVTNPGLVFQSPDYLLTGLATNRNVTDMVKAENSPAFYTIISGKKYPFLNPASLLAWNKKWEDTIVYPDELVNSLPNGETALSQYIQKYSTPQEPAIYLVKSGNKSLFPNGTVFDLWQANPNAIVRIPEILFNSLPDAPPVTPFVKGSGPAIYLVDCGYKKLLIDINAFAAWGGEFYGLTTLSDAELYEMPESNLLGQAVKTANSPTVYKVEDRTKAPFPSPAIFEAWGFSAINLVTPTALNLLTDSPPVSILAKLSQSDPTIFLLNGSNKKPFVDYSVFEAWRGNWEVSISQIPNRLPTDGSVNYLAKGPGPAIYFINSGTKKIFLNMDTLIAWGFWGVPATYINQSTLDAIPNSGEMSALAKGSDPAIYYIENGKKRLIPNLDVMASYGWVGLPTTTVSYSYLSQMPNAVPLMPNIHRAIITASNIYRVINSSGSVLGVLGGGIPSYATYYNGLYYFTDDVSLYWNGAQSVRFEPLSSSTIIEVISYSDFNYNGTMNYNRFRGTIEIVHSPSATWVVNELSINDYIAGLAEAPGGHAEYLKTMAVAARSYGWWHLSRGGKHAGEPFHLKNSRRGNGNDQVYAGYNFEMAATQYSTNARSTDNQVATYGGSPMLAAYSHGSYPRTLSALEVWGSNYPYLQSVADPYGDPARPCGTGGNHCVGLSASGAIGYAQNESKSYSWILGYYYTGTAISFISNPTVRIAIYPF